MFPESLGLCRREGEFIVNKPKQSNTHASQSKYGHDADVLAPELNINLHSIKLDLCENNNLQG